MNKKVASATGAGVLLFFGVFGFVGCGGGDGKPDSVGSYKVGEVDQPIYDYDRSGAASFQELFCSYIEDNGAPSAEELMELTASAVNFASDYKIPDVDMSTAALMVIQAAGKCPWETG